MGNLVRTRGNSPRSALDRCVQPLDRICSDLSSQFQLLNQASVGSVFRRNTRTGNNVAIDHLNGSERERVVATAKRIRSLIQPCEELSRTREFLRSVLNSEAGDAILRRHLATMLKGMRARPREGDQTYVDAIVFSLRYCDGGPFSEWVIALMVREVWLSKIYPPMPSELVQIAREQRARIARLRWKVDAILETSTCLAAVLAVLPPDAFELDDAIPEKS